MDSTTASNEATTSSFVSVIETEVAVTYVTERIVGQYPSVPNGPCMIIRSVGVTVGQWYIDPTNASHHWQLFGYWVGDQSQPA
ncbi:unnamed protein product [Soboliphyme baturini]|uniref:Levansucrase n=1 Tax=Soboliphyme baturini TaxID=241478 RepID=A0A183J398_9BILA|nr:unnamed protein product [Soboliphyme baturini]